MDSTASGPRNQPAPRNPHLVGFMPTVESGVWGGVAQGGFRFGTSTGFEDGHALRARACGFCWWVGSWGLGVHVALFFVGRLVVLQCFVFLYFFEFACMTFLFVFFFYLSQQKAQDACIFPHCVCRLCCSNDPNIDSVGTWIRSPV